jgi:hypothetical protein
MDRVRQGRVVLDLNVYIVTFRDMNERARRLTVEGERVKRLLSYEREGRIFDRHLEVI